MKNSANMRKMGLAYAYITHAILLYKQQLIWLMRVSLVISFLLLVSFQFIFAASVHSQSINSYEVSLKLNNESLLSGIKKIEAQTTFRFFYRKADINEVRHISLTQNTRTVEKTLAELLKNTGFSFRQIDNNILLEKRQQQSRYTIKGKVVGPEQQPLEFATVRITKANDQKIISTALADSSGNFNLTVYERGDYLLRVSSIEADSLTKKIVIGDEMSIQLANIVLHSSAKQLSNVTIRTRRPLITQEADRIIYDLQADPQSKVSSVLDMMRKVPYLSLDGQENILLKGSSGYRIFINGKPSAMVERNPKDVLRSIPASTIKSIEVITTPPSKYDAEGLAGIINIITNKEIANGYHGSVNVSEKGPVGGPGGGGSLTFKEGNFGLSAIAGVSRNDVPETSGDMSRTTTGTNPTRLEQHNTDLNNGSTAYAGLEVSYELDSLQLISGQLNWSKNQSTGLAAQSSVLTGANLQQYRLSNTKEAKAAGLDAALNYQLGFKANKNQLLTLSYRYMESNNSLFNHIDLFDQVNDDTPDYRQFNAESLEEQTLQADYVHPIEKLTIEAGLKGIFRTNKSDFQYRNLNALTGEFEKDQASSDIFNNSQDVLAVYNSYSYQTVDWQFKGGVRAEQTIIRGLYSAGNAQLQQKYLNVVPAIVANRKFDAHTSLSLSFSKRIQRPAIAQLNPFVDRSNPNFERSGNPDLRPITSSAFQISYLKSAKSVMNVALGYLYFNRVINAFSAYDPSTNVTFTRYENYGKGRVFKINVYFRYPIHDNWDVVFNSDLRHVTFYGIVDNITVKNSGIDLYVFGSSGYSFEKGWRANVDITYRKGGILLPLGRTNGFTASTFSVNKDVVENKLTLSAAVSNPLTRFRYVNEQIFGPNFLQTSSNQSYFRRFTLSLNYRFGKLKEEIKRNKRGIKNDDLSN
jgi:outer membrane receptor protein involved in Fe transport